MLNFNSAWRFDSPGQIAEGVSSDFSDLIDRIASQAKSRWGILEYFKYYFSKAGGGPSSNSSSESWAESDLRRDMHYASGNAVLFIEAFYDACEELKNQYPGLALPDLQRINRILFDRKAGYEIQPPNLVAVNPLTPVGLPERVVSLSEQAQKIIQNSWAESGRLLAEGRYRQAVQEVLWLLETVSTAFHGMETEAGTVQGKYFNRIVEDLRRHHKGKTLEMILNWMTTLHGFLSSPTGGGIRHGADLKTDILLQAGEAQLFCNLIRSYISYLVSEHERLNGTGTAQE